MKKNIQNWYTFICVLLMGLSDLITLRSLQSESCELQVIENSWKNVLIRTNSVNKQKAYLTSGEEKWRDKHLLRTSFETDNWDDDQ